MPSSIVPSTVKALINSLTGAMCERMAKIFQFTSFLHTLVVYLFNEAGLPSDAFKADLCLALSDCIGTGGGGNGGGGGTVNPNMPAPTGVTATDGAYSDKVRVSWNAVTVPTGIGAVTQYKLYRSLATNTNPSNAALIQSVAAPTVIFDDTTAVPGTVYRYWVIATNGIDSSAFSNGDNGNASVPTGVLTDIVDLRASLGFGYSFIALVWTPPAGATKYDVYRNTVNTFSSATKIYSGISPASTTLLAHPTSNPTFWDNDEELVLYDTPPSAAQNYYYWIVAKGDSPPSASHESNDALGRVNPPAIYNGAVMTLDYVTDTYTVPGATSKMRVVAKGSNGGGGGGNDTYGGGGGGGGGIVVEEFTVAPGDVILVVSGSPTPDTGNAASATDGADGGLITLKINGVTKVIAQPGTGAQWNASGGGAGGAGAFPGGTGTTSPTVYNGKDGQPGNGSAGGKSGYSFTQRKLPQANALGVFNGNGGNQHAGSGAKAISVNGDLSVGGSGGAGNVFLAFGT